MKEQLSHIQRPKLPWRDDCGLTECGIEVSESRCISRKEFLLRLKQWGRERTAITTCMTCFSTARRWTDWETDPRTAMSREITWECSWSKHGDSLKNELRAIEQLIVNHREEFDALVKQIAETPNLSDVRESRRPSMRLSDW